MCKLAAAALEDEIPVRFADLYRSERAMGLQLSAITGRLTGNRLRSEFVHVLIMADSGRLARYPLMSVACAPLPSITDLLAGGCAAPAANPGAQ